MSSLSGSGKDLTDPDATGSDQDATGTDQDDTGSDLGDTGSDSDATDTDPDATGTDPGDMGTDERANKNSADVRNSTSNMTSDDNLVSTSESESQTLEEGAHSTNSTNATQGSEPGSYSDLPDQANSTAASRNKTQPSDEEEDEVVDVPEEIVFANITEITTIGLIYIDLNETVMNADVNITNLTTAEFDVWYVKNSLEEDQNYTFAILNFTESQIIVQVNFSDPVLIS